MGKNMLPKISRAFRVATRKAAPPLLLACVLPFVLSCGSGKSAEGVGGPASEGGSCALAANTTPSPSVTNGCALRIRDTRSCASARSAQGLTGEWLKFSCRVALIKGSTAVEAASDGQPDHTSCYFAST